MLEELFDEMSEDERQGIIRLANTEFATAGTIFDIDASGVDFDGLVEVTIPYNAFTVDNESNIRFLHYNEELAEWEDVTIDINEAEDTVTGIMNALSPVVAAVVDDGTFSETYFERNPIRRMTVDGSTIIGEAHEGLISIPIRINNFQRTDQTYTILVQISDRDGVARNISWQTSILSRGQSTEVSSSWIAEDYGTYTIEIFIWNSLDNPSPLSQKTTTKIEIV
jgi:hypothetical protein